MASHAFVIMQVGREGSDERRRADEVTEYVLEPVLSEFGLQLVRADQDATPGAISRKMLSDLLSARVVIADLTGRNPNVYYELGVAHSFQKAVISLGQTAGLPFDVQDERVIPLPPPEEKLGAAEAAKARSTLSEALTIVMTDNFTPKSPLSEVANRQSLDALAANDPVAEQIRAMRDTMDEVRVGLLAELRAVRAEVDRESIAKEREETWRRTIGDTSVFEAFIEGLQDNPQILQRMLTAFGLPSPPFVVENVVIANGDQATPGHATE